MSSLTPEEQVGFYREKGIKVLLSAGFFLLFGIAYYFWFGPHLEHATGRVNALLYSFYELFGIEVGALVFVGIGVLISLFSLRHFMKSNEIRKTLGNG